MGKANGLFLIVAGAAALCTAYVMRSITDQRAPAPQQSEIVKGPSGGSDLRRAVVPEGWQAFSRAATPGPAEAETAPVVVTHAQRTNEAVVRKPIAPPAKSATPMPGDRASLARELQRELRRVGCYDGELNSNWTPATRKAIKAFIDRVNAKLPIDEPDHILLVLVQGHRDRACGVPCPAGQGLADDGGCLPNAILAQANKKAPERSTTLSAVQAAAPVITGLSTATTAAPPTLLSVLGEGRMALAGPSEDQARATAVAPTAPAPAYGSTPNKKRVTAPDWRSEIWRQ